MKTLKDYNINYSSEEKFICLKTKLISVKELLLLIEEIEEEFPDAHNFEVEASDEELDLNWSE